VRFLEEGGGLLPPVGPVGTDGRRLGTDVVGCGVANALSVSAVLLVDSCRMIVERLVLHLLGYGIVEVRQNIAMVVM